MRELWVSALGRMSYAEALDIQRAVAGDRIAGVIPEDVLLLVEHPPVVTLGRGAKASHLVASPALLAARGVEVFEVERGGDVTFHGPGQLVGYPVIDLKRHRRDLHWYLRQLECSLIDALAQLGVASEQRPGLTGVWVANDRDSGFAIRGSGTADDGTHLSVPAAKIATNTQGPAANARGSGFGSRGSGAGDEKAQRSGAEQRFRKIASIGVHARDWVTWHGFALNVTTDLSYFDLMVPCGIAGVDMTSVARELGRAPADAEVADAVVEALAARFGLNAKYRGSGFGSRGSGVGIRGSLIPDRH